MSNDSESSAGSSADLKETSNSSPLPLNGGKNRGPGRPKKVVVINKACTWCADNKVPLKYIINQNRNRKEFCSENCVAEFRNAYRKGACIVCDNVIRDNAPHRDYCSSFCLNSDSANNTGSMKGQEANPPTTANTAEGGKLSSTGGGGGTNNNNTTAENLNESTGDGANTPGKVTTGGGEDRLSPYGRSSAGGGIFQYEQLNVFDWTVYLKVRSFHGLRDYFPV